MKKLLLMKTVLLLFALVVGSTSVWAQSDYSALYTNNVTLTAGSNSGACTVNNHDGVKCGTSSKAGSVSFSVPSGTKYLHLHIAAWKGSTTSVSISPNGNGVPASINLTADDGISGNSPFTLSGTESSTDFYKVITFTNALTSNTTYTISSSNRFAIWGVNSEAASSDPSSEAAFAVTAPSINFPATTTYTQAATTASGYTGTVTYEITANTAGATLEGTTLTVTQEGSVTVKATAPAITGWAKSEATYTLTVNDTREAAGLAFTTASYTKTWGEEFTGQALTNPHTLPVTWSSTDETVASVNALGEVTMLKAGSTDIKATFAGNASYKNDIASYTLTINKAPAGLSYTTTSFDIMLNDNTFEAPALNNPNNLTVTYASNNTAVATVNTTTGVLAYVASAVGTAKITASFAGDERYYPGSANYTINIVDPNAKGTKYNPYTVAEVIDGTATGSGIYVVGYIVGEYVGKTTNPRTSSFTTDANIAIAGEFTSTPTAAASIPIQLGTDALKNAWGCQTTNGALLGYKVLIKGNKDTYFTVNGIKNTSEVAAVSVPVTPGYNKITYVTPYKMDFSEVSGLKAYVATDAASSGVTMTRVETVPENTPLLLIGTAGTTYNVPVAASATAPATNYLVKGDGTTVFDGSTYDYILYSDGKFYQIGSGTVATNKAYLHLDAAPSGARALDIVIDDDVTAIETVKSEKANNEYFNLAGQRVANPTKGLYIVNGKKVIIK